MNAPFPEQYPRVDLGLARRLERAEAESTIAYVEARRAAQPDTGSRWCEIDDTWAVFDGAASPLTQTFGLGLAPPRASALDELERFFSSRQVPTAHEVCALADPSTWEHLSSRGYSPIEASTVLVRPATVSPTVDAGRVTSRLAGAKDLMAWGRVFAHGLNGESPDLVETLERLAPAMAQSAGACCFLAELDGEPIAAGMLSLQQDIAVLGGASTLPVARRQGAQAALLRARLSYAAESGAALAMLVAAPGSPSQRNAERHGFRPAYVRSKWWRAAQG